MILREHRSQQIYLLAQECLGLMVEIKQGPGTFAKPNNNEIELNQIHFRMGQDLVSLILNEILNRMVF